MGDWPKNYVVRHAYHTLSAESLGDKLAGQGLDPRQTSLVPVANRVIYIPVVLPVPIVAKRLFHLNTGTISGNIDVGVYNDALAKVVSSGSTLMAGTGVLQFFNITDTSLPSGRYYFAVTVDNTLARFNGPTLVAGQPGMMGIFMETTVGFGLPATATPVTGAAAAFTIVGMETGRVT